MPSLISLMADLLSGSETRAERAVPGLIALGGGALPALLEAARSDDPDRRWWAVRVLAESSATASSDLLPFLKDSAAEVRQVAALGLSAHADESAIPALIDLLHDEDALAAGLAGNALVRVGRDAVPALLELLDHAPQAVRIQALRALVELKDHRAIPAMMKIMQEDSAVLGHWAQEGLERLGLNMVYIKPS